MADRRGYQWRGKLGLLAVVVNSAAGGCSNAIREAARGGVNEVHAYLGGPSRALAAHERVDTAPERVWRARAGRGTLGAVAMGERVTAVATVDRWVYALDTRTGQTLWRRRADTPFGATPVMGGGMVYAASEGADGVLVGIDMYSGKRRWQARTGGVDAPILLHDHSVYAVTSRGVAVAHRASDGRQRWRRATGPSRTGPIAAGPWIAFVTVTDTLFVLDTASGAVRARTALPSGSAAPLALLDDSTVVVSSPGGSIMAVALPTGRLRWEVPTTAPVFGTPVVSGDTVFALTSHCTLWTIPRGAPAEADTAALGCGPTLAAPLLVRGGVVVASVGGELLYYDRLRRRRVWTQVTGGELRHPPALRHGQLVVAPIIGDVLSFR